MYLRKKPERTSTNNIIPGLILASSLLLSAATVFAEKKVLDNQDWLFSPEKRALLEFITECALSKDQFLSITKEGMDFEFYGKMGAAPNWNGYNSSLTLSEQRWVSACVLARVNYYGNPVPINLRSDPDSGFFIPYSPKDQADFPVFEAGFFGNIFEKPQKKYVCTGTANSHSLVEKNRICSLPPLDTETKNSNCGFYIVGDCDIPDFFDRDNHIYKEVVFVWLQAEDGEEDDEEEDK